MQQVALGVVALVLVVVVGLFVVRDSMNWYGDPTLPTDAVLEARFKEQEPELELLVGMALTDRRVVRIASDFTWLDTNASWPRPESEWGLSKERWQEYRTFFKKLRLEDGIVQGTESEIVYLISASRGMVTNGSMKGYAYSKTELSPTVQSVDDPVSMPKGTGIAYKKLKEHWYLFYWN